MGTHMREARARLTGVSGGISFDYELLNLFVSSQLKSAFALPILAIVVAAYCTFWANTAGVIMWLFMVATTQAIQLVLCRQFCNADPHAMNVREWGGKIAASEFLMAATWASLVYVASGSTGTPGAHIRYRCFGDCCRDTHVNREQLHPDCLFLHGADHYGDRDAGSYPR